MNMENLRINYHRLISHMEATGYSKDYIGRVCRQIQWIITEAEDRGWGCYDDIYQYYRLFLCLLMNWKRSVR